MNKIAVLFCFLLSVFFTYGQEVEVGTGTATMRQPLSSYHGYSRSAALYTSAEINQVGFINKLAWDIGAIKGERPVKIYLKEVESTALVAGNWSSFIQGAAVVYEGRFTPTSVGFNTIDLHNSFNYTGGNKNLLVLVETNFGGNGNGDGINGLVIKSSAATNMHFEAGMDNTAPTTNLSATTNRPNLKLTFGPEITCKIPTAITITANEGNAFTVSWTAAAGVTNYDLYLGTTAEAPAADATLVSVTGTSHRFEGVTSSTTYYVWMRSHCSDTDQSFWVQLPIRTNQIAATLPYMDDFEGADNWDKSSNSVNKWVVGTAVQNGGTKSLYISKDNGTTNTYDTSATTVAHAYRDLVIPTGTNEIAVNFDWRCVGEGGTWDYFRVWAVPASFEPTTGAQITAAADRIRLGRSEYNANTQFLREQLVVNATAFAGQNMRLVFEWRQDASGGTQPPGAVDNLNISVITCSAPTALQLNAITSTTATVAWTATTGDRKSVV